MTAHEVETYRRLAFEVIAQVIRDCDRAQLATWLASDDAELWRDWLPDLNAATVVDRLQRRR